MGDTRAPRFKGAPDRVGEALAAAAPGAENGVAVINLLRKMYHASSDAYIQAVAAFLRQRQHLEAEVVTEVLRAPFGKAIFLVLCNRLGELGEDHQRTLLEFDDTWYDVSRPVRAHHLIHHAPKDLQEKWAVSETLERRLAVVEDPEVATPLRRQAAEGLGEVLAAEDRLEMRTVEALVSVWERNQVLALCADQRFDVEKRWRVRMSPVLCSSPEEIAEVVLEWSEEVAATSPFTPEMFGEDGQLKESACERMMNEGDRDSSTRTWGSLILLAREVSELCGISLPKTSRYLAELSRRERDARGSRRWALLAEMSQELHTHETLRRLVEADLYHRRARRDRRATLDEAPLAEVAEMLAAEGVRPEDLTALEERFNQDPESSRWAWVEMDEQMQAAASKTKTLGEYWRLRQKADPLVKPPQTAYRHLLMADLAETARVDELVMAADPEEFNTYLGEHGIEVRDVLALWTQIPELTLAEALTILQ